MPPVAVIILNWNGAKLLREFLPSVIANTDQSIGEVIVADNGSDDDSLRVVAAEFPAVKVIKFDTNHGFAEGYNLAIERTRYQYTVLLNSDVAPAPGWLNALYDHMEAHPEVGACQPKLLSYKEPALFEYAGASGGFLDRNGYPYCRGRVFGTVEEDRGQYDDVIPVFWATGAALMTRTEVYLRAGGLDKDFFAHMEEIDLCWRIHRLGYGVDVVPQSVVYHLGGGSLPASSPRKTYLNFRNNLLLLYKNLPAREVGAALIKRRLLDTIAFVKFALTMDWGNARAVLKAHRDFRRMKRAYTPSGEVNLLKGSPNILVDYYLRRRMTYDKLG